MENTEAVELVESKAPLTQEEDSDLVDSDFEVTHNRMLETIEKAKTGKVMYLNPKFKHGGSKNARDISQLGGFNNIEIFKGEIDPNDISQGNLGTCYLLCSIASLAEKPNRIKKLFLSQEKNEQGVYGVYFYKDGKLTSIIMDEKLATENGKICFSGSKDGELWVMLLEKAYAQMWGGYSMINGGLNVTALRDLTGAPSFMYSTDREDLFEIIKNADEREYVISCACTMSRGFALVNSFLPCLSCCCNCIGKMKGVVPGHAYSLLKVVEVKSGCCGPVKLVQLRNPWGQFEWKGAWSDNSSKWNDRIRKEVGFTNEKDGKFWMEWSDFGRYFPYASICKIVDDHKMTFREFRVPDVKHYFLYPITIKETGEYTIGCTTPLQRNKYKAQDIRMILFKSETEDYTENPQYIAGNARDMDGDCWLEFKNIEAGTYYLFVDIWWKDEHPKNMRKQTISVYGKADAAIGPDCRDTPKTIHNPADLLTPLLEGKHKQVISNPSLKTCQFPLKNLTKTTLWKNHPMPADATTG